MILKCQINPQLPKCSGISAVTLGKVCVAARSVPVTSHQISSTYLHTEVSHVVSDHYPVSLERKEEKSQCYQCSHPKIVLRKVIQVMLTVNYFPMDECNSFSILIFLLILPESEREEFLPGSRLCSACAYKQGTTIRDDSCTSWEKGFILVTVLCLPMPKAWCFRGREDKGKPKE